MMSCRNERNLMTRTARSVLSTLFVVLMFGACTSDSVSPDLRKRARNPRPSASTAADLQNIPDLEFRSWAFYDFRKAARAVRTLHIGDRSIRIPHAIRAFDVCSDKEIAIVAVGRKGAMFKGSHDPKDEDVLLVDLRSGEILKGDRSHWWPPDDVQISPDGNLVAVGCSYGTWPAEPAEAPTSRNVGTLRLSIWTTSDLTRVSEVRWGPAQRRLPQEENGSSQPKVPLKPRASGEPPASPAGRALAMVASTGRADWEHATSTGEFSVSFSTQYITWSSDSRFVALYARPAFAAVYDVTSRQHDEIRAEPPGRLEATVLDGRRLVAVCTDGTELQWVPPRKDEDLKAAHTRLIHARHDTDVVARLQKAWFDSNHRLGEALTSEHAWYDDRGVVQYDILRRQLRRFPIPEAKSLKEKITRVVVSPDGKMIAVATPHEIRVFGRDGNPIQDQCVRTGKKEIVDYIRWVRWNGAVTLAYVLGPPFAY